MPFNQTNRSLSDILRESFAYLIYNSPHPQGTCCIHSFSWFDVSGFVFLSRNLLGISGDMLGQNWRKKCGRNKNC